MGAEYSGDAGDEGAEYSGETRDVGAEYSGDAGDVETGDGPLAESGFLSLGEQGDIDGSVETPPEPGFSIGESAGSTRHSSETGPVSYTHLRAHET